MPGNTKGALRNTAILLLISGLFGCDPHEPMGTALPDQNLDGPSTSSDDVNGLSALATPLQQDVALVSLGKKLFEDPRLSGDNTVSCATCHVVAAGGDDGRPVSIGVGGASGTHNAPTVLNSGLNFRQFWDGRAKDLDEQVEGPIHNPLEMNTKWQDIIPKLQSDADMVAAFKASHLSITQANVIKAIVAYENALVTLDSPFDRYLKGDESAISNEAKKGLDLFVRLGCVSCHQGQNVGGNMYQRFGVFKNYYEDEGRVSEIALGRYNVTGNPDDKYVFKVPSLRNVTQTAPYFHDGSVASLEGAINIMATYQLGRSLEEADVTSIIAFLETLTGDLDESLK
ncbi:MAG: cytochrome-c peroxidase [Pseudomonadota bacterium]